MPIPILTIHRVAALVFLIASLVLLADQTARVELTQAVGTILNGATGAITHVAGAADMRQR